jgi:sarcosine oxidase subunit alpha
MPNTFKLTIDGRKLEVPAGTTVAAAILANQSGFRRSVKGDLRGPLCGMGVCFECRATINRRSQQRTCQILCEDGMAINTDE